MKLIDYIPTGSDPGQCHDIGRLCRLLPHPQRHDIAERPRHEKPVGDTLGAGVH